VKPLYQQALELFTRNLGMIIPALLALIITVVLGFAIGLIAVALLPWISFTAIRGIAFVISFTAIRGIAFVIGFIVGIVITFLIQLEAYESVDVMNGMVPDVGSAWRRTTANTGTILPTALLVGLIYGLLALAGVPGAFVIEGLVLILAYVITSHLALGRAMGLGASLNWYSNSFSRDGNSAVVVLIGSILSTIPILNLFTIPYTSLLSTLMARNYP
jgi:hypothetical protein